MIFVTDPDGPDSRTALPSWPALDALPAAPAEIVLLLEALRQDAEARAEAAGSAKEA